MNELALFAGAGGGILGGKLLGWRTLAAVEQNLYAASVLAQRQNEGFLPPFPIWDDVCTFDGKPWKGLIDVVSGGFPCQNISSAGPGGGIEGEKSSLWGQMARIVGECRPNWVFAENSPMLTSRGLEKVLQDLSKMGYDAKWGCFSAGAVGANHKRERIWILAADSNVPQRERSRLPRRVHESYANIGNARWWEDTSPLHRMDDGVAHRVDRLTAIGNGQVPIVAAKAFVNLYSLFAAEHIDM